MYAVRNRRGYLATFDYKPDADQWCRDYVSLHGHGAWVERTEA